MKSVYFFIEKLNLSVILISGVFYRNAKKRILMCAGEGCFISFFRM